MPPLRPRIRRLALAVAMVLTPALGAAAQQGDQDAPQEEVGGDGLVGPNAPQEEDPGDAEAPPGISLGFGGLHITSADGNYRFQLWLRGQFRYSYPFDRDPRDPGDFAAEPVSSFAIRRARLKIGGHFPRPWLSYYFEYDFVGGNLLDLRFTLTKLDWLQLRVGQWKVNYNRERVDSSGKQQFVERSIVNREFTVDRQAGVMLAGHVFKDSALSSWYMLGAFSGNGRGNPNDDDVPMLLARWQWNFLGRDLPSSQSDLLRHPRPTGTIALATLSNTSQYTRFSTGGGGQLDGIDPLLDAAPGTAPEPPGEPGQYRLRQYLVETAFKDRGLRQLLTCQRPSARTAAAADTAPRTAPRE